jgi:DNA-binding NarL/FixJ family response regulator
MKTIKNGGNRAMGMKLFIADDNVPFRTRLASVLGGIDGIEIVGQTGDVPGTMEAIKRTKPDAVILDINMPGGSGLDVAQALKRSRHAPTIIMLTVGPRSEYETLSYLLGADYFFQKSSDLRRLAKMLTQFARNHVM